jgi:O-antigen ligase
VLALEVTCFSVFILWVLKTGASGEKPFASVRPYMPLLLFIIICFLQIVPLPGFILGALSGKSLEVWETTGRVVSSLGAGGGGGFHTISVYPDATLRKILLLLAYIAFGVAVSRCFRSDGWIKLALTPVFAMLFVEAALGIYQYLGSGGSEDATGSFFNRNHYAGFLEMTFPLALGYVLSLGDWRGASGKPLFRRMLSSENLQKQALFLFLLGLAFLAVLFSRSRMGIFSVIVSLVFFTSLSSRSLRSGRGLRRMVYTVVGVAVFFGLFIGLYPVVERFLHVGENLPSRTELWKDAAAMVGDFTLFGSGLGTFGYAYPLYKLAVVKPIIYLHAHNDYLELLIETGVLGFASLTAALAVFLYTSLKALARLGRDEDYFRLFILAGALTGVFSMLVHSLVDFGLQIPSNGLYFAFLIGLSAGAGCGAGKDSGSAARSVIRKE